MTKFDPKHRLQQIFPRTMGRHELRGSDIHVVMSHARQWVELSSRQEQFSVLNLYCNWCLHAELRDSKVCYRILAEASKLISAHRNNEERLDVEISKQFLLVKLRQQLIEVLRLNDVSTIFLEAELGWREFGGQFFKLIMHKRLRWCSEPATNKKSAKRYLSMRSQVNGDPAKMIASIRFQNDLPDRYTVLYWIAEMEDGSEVMGRLKNLEVAADFPANGLIGIVCT